jgi:predicted nucleic acid-binding protein
MRFLGVLVDTSVWISYFKSGKHSDLDELIINGLALTNDIILTELLPVLHRSNRYDIIESMVSLSKVPLNISWDGIRYLQIGNLERGINKVGLPDLMIVQQIIEYKISLFTEDKHFGLMQKWLHYDLFETAP